MTDRKSVYAVEVKDGKLPQKKEEMKMLNGLKVFICCCAAPTIIVTAEPDMTALPTVKKLDL